ncbi:MAG: SRPBCC domain-containing protein [Thermoproteus sp.]
MRVTESGEFFVDRPPNEVVAMLKNPEVAARLIPGLSRVEKSGDEYVGEASIKLGHLSGKMTVRFRYSKVESNYVEVAGRATGLQTTADFKISAEVNAQGSGSIVKWRFDGEARGLAASLAPSIVRTALRSMAEDAARNLAETLKRG